jgi:hypothetical protein
VQGDPDKFLYYFDGQVPEGIYTARMIKKHDLFMSLPLLHLTINRIEGQM